MKVVILHQHFNTPTKGGAIRSYYLAKALSDAGIEVAVIAAHAERNYVRTTLEGIDVHYLPVPYDNSFGFFRRLQAFVRYARKSVALAARFADADLCYAISTPLTVGWAAMQIRRRYGVPFFFEVGDLWPDAPIQLNVIRNVVLKRALYRLEKAIYRRAEMIVALSTPIQSAVKHKISGKKTVVIPNMADCEYYRPEIKDLSLEEKYNVSGKFVVSYIGAIGYANGLEYFVACASACRHDERFRFLLCGEGAELPNLKREAQRLDLANLTFIDFKSRAGVREVLNVTDAVFVCYRNVPILETGSPNKYFDGLAAGKLIIINFGGWIKKEIGEYQHGVCLDPTKPETFRDAVHPFVIDATRARRAARVLAEQKYSRTRVATAFAKLFTPAD